MLCSTISITWICRIQNLGLQLRSRRRQSPSRPSRLLRPPRHSSPPTNRRWDLSILRSSHRDRVVPHPTKYSRLLLQDHLRRPHPLLLFREQQLPPRPLLLSRKCILSKLFCLRVTTVCCRKASPLNKGRSSRRLEVRLLLRILWSRMTSICFSLGSTLRSFYCDWDAPLCRTKVKCLKILRIVIVSARGEGQGARVSSTEGQPHQFGFSCAVLWLERIYIPKSCVD